MGAWCHGQLRYRSGVALSHAAACPLLTLVVQPRQLHRLPANSTHEARNFDLACRGRSLLQSLQLLLQLLHLFA